MEKYHVRLNVDAIYEVWVEAENEDEAIDAAWVAVDKGEGELAVDTSRLLWVIREDHIHDPNLTLNEDVLDRKG